MLYGFMVGGGGVTLLLWEVLALMMFVLSCGIIFCGCIWTCC
jgi:hypothetical protein